MEMTIIRNESSDIYVGGELLVNGTLFCSTIEWVSDLLPEDIYQVNIRNGEITVENGAQIEQLIGNHGAIHVGSWRDRDFLYDERAVLARLYNLIDYAIDNQEPITLTLRR